jgi:amino acid permease
MKTRRNRCVSPCFVKHHRRIRKMGKIAFWIIAIVICAVILHVVLGIIKLVLPIAILAACIVVIYHFVSLHLNKNKSGNGNKIYVDKDKD